MYSLAARTKIHHMSKDTILFLCGIGIALLPFLGFPNRIREWLFVLLGVVVIGVALSLRRELMARERRREASRSGVFVESNVTPYGPKAER